MIGAGATQACDFVLQIKPKSPAGDGLKRRRITGKRAEE